MSIACYSKNCARVKHIPSGHEVIVDNNRQMHKNKDTGIKIIAARLNADRIGLQRPIIEESCSGTMCPICEQGILEERHEYLKYKYNCGFRLDPDGDYEVLSLYLVCCGGEDSCGSEQIDGYCLSYNKETMEILYEMKENV